MPTVVTSLNSNANDTKGLASMNSTTGASSTGGSGGGKKWGFRRLSFPKLPNSLSKQTNNQPPTGSESQSSAAATSTSNTANNAATVSTTLYSPAVNHDNDKEYEGSSVDNGTCSINNGNGSNVVLSAAAAADSSPRSLPMGGTQPTSLSPADSEDEEELDVTGHQTVLKHLAQQVKVGMDLTRVTLPTFILEKRSLLEMYADFFAHPEFFLLTSQELDAKQRFMFIVKWYLSSFHTGRKGAIAKKPFNPIIGEIFRCHWKLPSSVNISSNDAFSVNIGDINANGNQVLITQSEESVAGVDGDDSHNCRDQSSVESPEDTSVDDESSLHDEVALEEESQHNAGESVNNNSVMNPSLSTLPSESELDAPIDNHEDDEMIVGLATLEEKLIKTGPVPWSSENDATFVAEQVSHHPPVSAFYAECIDKRVEVNGFFYPKSKFLGLSIGVNMIGEARVKLLDKDEEYIVSFPNGYGRSILTVPWAELGGKCQIVCEKSGFKANVTFHTKSFYSKERHNISCDCFDPKGIKFCTIKGQWNGKMYIVPPGQKTTAGVTGGNALFLDTTRMPSNKKCVKPLSEQKENESRNLWKHVISALKCKDIDRATAEKRKLEEKQRNDAKSRAEQKIQWQTKEFRPDGKGGYVYKDPLSCRLLRYSSTSPPS